MTADEAAARTIGPRDKAVGRVLKLVRKQANKGCTVLRLKVLDDAVVRELQRLGYKVSVSSYDGSWWVSWLDQVKGIDQELGQ